MGALKEYAGVITAAVTVVAALGALGLWAINVQVTPELNRLEGRIEQLDGKIDTNLKVINQRFNLVDERFERIDERFEHIDGRFDRIDDRFDRVEDEIKYHPQRHQDHSLEASASGRDRIAAALRHSLRHQARPAP